LIESRGIRVDVRQTLGAYLDEWAGKDPRHLAVRDALMAVAGVCDAMQARIAGGALVADHSALVGQSLDGDGQKALDVWANDALIAAFHTLLIWAAHPELS
jgi:fructose-1,6-bisphosphatase I